MALYLLGGSLLLALIYVVIFLRAKRWTLIDSCVLGLAIYQVGACVLVFDVGLDDASEVILYSSSLGFVVACTLGVVLRFQVVNRLARLDYGFERPLFRLDRQFVKLSAVALVVANIFIIVVIFVRFSDIFISMQGGFLLEVRKQISSGERGFLAPGLIKQVRDIISPAVASYLILFLSKSNGKALGALLVVFVFGATLIGGQRFPIVVLFLSLGVVYIYLLKKRNGKILNRKRNLYIYGCVMFLIVAMLNLLLGRMDEAGGVFSALLMTLKGLLWRVFLVVPYENYLSIDYVLSLKFDAFDIWTQELASILPGVKSSLSNDMHAHLGGSFQGNSVLGASVSAYMNFGYLGVALFSLASIFVVYFMELLVAGLSSRLLYVFRFILFFQIPLWYSPFLILLNGGLAFVFLTLLVIARKVFVPQGGRQVAV